MQSLSYIERFYESSQRLTRESALYVDVTVQGLVGGAPGLIILAIGGELPLARER